ncbi:hypothetical protein LCGC14_2046890, partial [marine sediment metagenome]
MNHCKRSTRDRASVRPTRKSPASIAIAILVISMGILSITAVSARAAEIRLRPQYRSDGTVVTLGHVADIITADQRQAETLAAIELFAPPVAGRRFVRMREIQDRLLAHRINLVEHRFSGSSQV